MSTDDVDTSANDLGGAEDMLSPAESTDSDELRNADGDEVVDPPEDWSGVTKKGMTAEEEREGESLDERLSEEIPDVTPEDVAVADAQERVNEVIDGTDPIDTGLGDDVAGAAPAVHRGQIDGAPEDGDSLFQVVDDVTEAVEQA